MRRLIVLSISALLLSLFFADHADARGGFGGGGGGFAGGGFRAAAIGGGFAGPGRWGGVGIGRPGWGVAGIGRPGWGVVGRPGWGWRGRWPLWAGAAGLGLAGAAYYGSYNPYGYDDDCPMVRRTIWDGYGYRIVWVNACGYY
ncbi:MAG: hypothetical protein WCE79_26655 [Xanthobacteraceae bacterium]